MLVQAIAGRERGALEEAYRQHGTSVFVVASTVCGRNAGADVTQDVFLRLWTSPDRYDPTRGSLRAFLVTQARSRSLDALRSERKRLQRELGSRPAPISLVDDTALADVESAAVRAMLSSLPQREKEPILLAYIGGRSYCEVASMLGIPEGTIKSRIRAGLHRMRAMVEESGAFSLAADSS